MFLLSGCFVFLANQGEEEISKARKPISEKDAEERLSGLNKVLHLCFCGLLVVSIF